MLPSRRSRSYCAYDLQDKSMEKTYMRPVPFGQTQEAWFLRPNLIDRKDGPFNQAPTNFAKESYVKRLPDVRNQVQRATRVCLTVKNETFFSNKFKTPTYTYVLLKEDTVQKLHHLIAQTLSVDVKLFSQTEGQPEGFNVFWHVDANVQGTKMIKLNGAMKISDLGIDKNSVLLLKYRCRESKY